MPKPRKYIIFKMYSGEEYFTMHSKSGYKAEKNYKKTINWLTIIKEYGIIITTDAKSTVFYMETYSRG